jgi:hypothetical protein
MKVINSLNTHKNIWKGTRQKTHLCTAPSKKKPLNRTCPCHDGYTSRQDQNTMNLILKKKFIKITSSSRDRKVTKIKFLHWWCPSGLLNIVRCAIWIRECTIRYRMMMIGILFTSHPASAPPTIWGKWWITNCTRPMW